MDEITNISLEALDRYFHALSVFGYTSYTQVDKLILLLFIEEILSGDFSQYVTDEDLRTLTNTLYCIAGSNCMIDYPTFKNQDELSHTIRNEFIPKLTEDGLFRFIDEEIRVKA